MKTIVSIIIVAFLSLQLFSCLKEISGVGSKDQNTDSLPPNYPFASGYCKGVSLGFPVSDTDHYLPVLADPLPVSIFLEMPKAGNQGGQGSCSAWATVYGAGSYYVHTTTGRPYSDTVNLSPTFTYNQITKGDCKCTSILDHLYLLQTQGAVPLSIMPYDADDCTIQPDSSQKIKAVPYKIQGWQKVDLHNLALIKRALYEKKPVLFAITTDDGFHHLPPPYIWKQRLGSLKQSHAMVVTGYDDNKRSFRIMNSWSAAWGDKGFAWIDYDFFMANVLEGGYIVI